MAYSVASKTLCFGSYSSSSVQERSQLPVVSIIMPAYNAIKTISASVDSILAQTYLSWELLIVDDCSTDATSQLGKKYESLDNRIRYIKTPVNSGAARARNLAIKEASGRFIAFLDSDDLWMPEKLSNQVWFMLHNDLAFSYSSYSLIENVNRNFTFHPPKRLTYGELLKTNSIGCLTAIYDSERLGKRYMPVSVERQEDYALWLNICKEEGVLYGLAEPLAKYRVGTTSLSSNKILVSKNQWKVYRLVEGLNIMRSVYYQVNYMLKGYFKYKIQKKSSSLLLTDRN